MGRESIAELLQSSGVGAAQNAIVQGLEGYSLLGQLSLDVLMAVDAQFGVVGEVGAELEKERAEVLVDAIEVVMIDHARGPHDPGVRLTGLGIAALLGAEDGCLLLHLPTTTIPSVPLKRDRYSWVTSSLRWPLVKVIMGICSSLTKQSTAAMKDLLMGSMRAEEAKVAPR